MREILDVNALQQIKTNMIRSATRARCNVSEPLMLIMNQGTIRVKKQDTKEIINILNGKFKSTYSAGDDDIDTIMDNMSSAYSHDMGVVFQIFMSTSWKSDVTKKVVSSLVSIIEGGNKIINKLISNKKKQNKKISICLITSKNRTVTWYNEIDLLLRIQNERDDVTIDTSNMNHFLLNVASNVFSPTIYSLIYQNDEEYDELMKVIPNGDYRNIPQIACNDPFSTAIGLNILYGLYRGEGPIIIKSQNDTMGINFRWVVRDSPNFA